jgi:hypothetical protein
MKAVLLSFLLMGQVSSDVDIHLRDGRELKGHVVGIYQIGLKGTTVSGALFFIPYSQLPADWQAKCARSKHHSATELSTSMQDL